MKAVKVNTGNVKEFIAYCKKYAPEHDESFIPRDDYMPDENEYAFLLLDDSGGTAGAASLMKEKAYRAVSHARLRILHCIDKKPEGYKILFESILACEPNVDNIFGFILEGNTEVIAIWEDLGLKIKRYSWLLERETGGIENAELPNGFEVKQLHGSRDEEAWCEIINSAFADIEGHIDMVPEDIEEMRKEKDHMEEGMKIVWSGNSPAGLLKLIKTNEDGEDILFIETLGVHRSFQGQGLGKALLRYAVNFGRDMGIKRSMLTVNAENSNAANLYFNEGFKKTVVYICYNKKL